MRRAKKIRYVWVIVGLEDDSQNFGGTYIIPNEKHGAHSSFGKAKAELLEISQDIYIKTCNGQFEVAEHNLGEDSLEVIFENGSVEYYKIYKMRLN